MKKSFMIGTDPEFVVRNSKRAPVAAPNVIPYTKSNRYESHIGSLFSDNANLEIAVNPAASEEQFVEIIKEALRVAHEVLPEGHYLQAASSLDFPKKELEHEECKFFGCSPDWDAWTKKENVIPDAAVSKTFRSCGGHIHIGHVTGYDFLQENYDDAVKAMDTFVGIPSLILDNEPSSVKRRSLYGKAGCFRPTEYGVEYRSLSNFWLRHPNLVRFIYNTTEIALRSVEENVLHKIPEVKNGKIRKVINDGDAKEAEKIFVNLIDHFPELMTHFYNVNKLTSNRTRFTSLRAAWGL